MTSSFSHGALVAALILSADLAPAVAELVKIRDFALPVSRDRRVLFDMAVSPSGDVYAFMAKNSGDWRLYRIRNWLTASPIVDTLILPGFFSKKDESDLQSLAAPLFTTQDGAYAVCVGGATWWKNSAGRAVPGTERADDMISVVDLSTLKVVANTRTAGLIDGFRDTKIDHEGYVVVDAMAVDEPKRGAFVRLALPSLTAGPKCSYKWIRDSPTKEHREPTSEHVCRDALRGSGTFDQYFHTEWPGFAWPSAVCKNNSAEFCRWPGEFTADGKYGVLERREGHDNILGNWVVSRLSYVVFTAARILAK